MLASRLAARFVARTTGFAALNRALPAIAAPPAFRMQQFAQMSGSAEPPVTIKTPSGAMPGTADYAHDPYNGRDAVKDGGRLPPGDPSRRAFTYFLLGGAKFVYASIARLAVLKLVNFMNASADVLALASIEVPIGGIPDGGCIVVKWRGKPVFIKKRNEEELADVMNVDWQSLRDPQSDRARRQQEQTLVVLGVCTHLGCVPISNAGDFKGGWFCPCHGSHYDASGRIRKGPAPLNLEVPPYDFMEGGDKIKIG